MHRQIFISKDNQPHGPFNDEQLGQKLISGEIEVSTLACEEGGPAWRPVSEVLDAQFVSKVLEFRRASQALSAQIQSTSGISQPGRAVLPPVSVIEPDGRPVQVPGTVAVPSVVLTSMPMPVAPGAGTGGSAPPPGVPVGAAAPAPSGVFGHSGVSVRLAEEAIGSDSGQSSGRPLWQFAVGAIAVLAVGGFFAWEPVSHRWNASKQFESAQLAMGSGRYADAMLAAHAASKLMPDSGIYLSGWQDARRRALDELKAGVAKSTPLDYLVAGRAFLAKYEPALGDDGIAATRDWLLENEAAALKQVREAFDGDLAGLDGLLKPHEGKLAAYFAGTEHRNEARRLHDNWLTLRSAYAAWEAGRQVPAIELLMKVPADLQNGPAFGKIGGEVLQLREAVLEKLTAVTDLANGRHYIEAMPQLDELEVHAGWLPEVKQERQRIQLSGENYYASQLVGAVRAKNAAATSENLRNYMQFRRRPLTDAQLGEFLEIRDFTTYLSKLTDYGLRPRGKAARQNYADVVLVACNLPNFTNPDEAKAFLADAYFDWGRAELERGRSSPAAYLALLAEKYGHAASSELFNNALEKVQGEFTFAIRPQPMVFQAQKAPRSFGTQVEADVLNAVRNSLPSWLKWQAADSGGSGDVEPLVRVDFTPTLFEFSRRNDRVARTASGRYKFPDIVEDNPEWFTAQEAAANAESAYSQAQTEYQQAKASADQLAAQSQQTESSGLALFGAIMSGVTQGVSDSALQTARQNLADARATAARTPRQVRRQDIRDLNWTEFDVTNEFRASLRLEFRVGDKLVLTRSLSADAQFKSMERESAHNDTIKAVQRKEPGNDEVEAALMEKVRPQVTALQTPAFLQQLKNSLGTYIAQQAGAIDAEAQANAFIGYELLWWKHPLYNPAALKSPDLLGRFGDVIN